jgi:hypothetical protein
VAPVGAIAQLGERVLCKHEVVGSIPSGSTIRQITSDNDGKNQTASMRKQLRIADFDIVKAG